MNKVKENNEMLEKINQCFLSLGSAVEKNIYEIIKAAGEIFDGAYVLYKGEEGQFLCVHAGWQMPEDLDVMDKKEGHICYDVIKRGDDKPFIVYDLDRTSYAETDPNVNKYKLKTYIGFVVKCKDKAVGSLCVVFQNNRDFSETELEALSILAKALGMQEKWRSAEEE